MNVDPSTIKPVHVQTTLLFVNNFIVNTTKFLNNFSESCDIKLTNISSKLNNLDVVLSVLEAKLNSVPGLETDDIPPPNTTSTAPSSNADTSTNNEQDETTQEVDAPQQSGGQVKASEHPDYAPFFKLSRLGVPMAVVSAKVQAAGLDPSVLEDPDAMIGQGGGGGGSKPSSEQSTTTQQQQQPVESSTSGMVKASEHPDYAPFFKLTRLGVPVPVVSGKVSAAGLDPAVLDNPDAMIPITTGGGAGGAPTGGNAPLSRRIFDKHDTKHSGHISSEQFQSMAQDFGVFLTGDALSLAIKVIDRDGNGTIEYDEFLAWYKKSNFSSLSLDDTTLQRRNAAAQVFRKYDKDNSGSIDLNEFRGLYDELKASNLTSHAVETALEDMDSDGNGKIEFNEFVEWLDRH